MAKASLLVIQGVNQGARFDIGSDPVSIGRGVRNEIRILDTEVSRNHAVVEYINGAFRIMDRDSSNGTFINGRAVHTGELRSSDQIQIGRSVIVFNTIETQSDETRIHEFVNLVGREADDRSSIVGQMTRPATQKLLQDAVSGEQAPAHQSLANLHAIYRISEEAVRSTNSIEQTLTEILKLTIEAVGASRGCMLLTDPESGDLAPRVYSSPLEPVPERPRMPVSRTIVEYVRRHGQGVRTSDAQRDGRFESGESIVRAGIREAICVPMQGHSELMGVAYIDTTTHPAEVMDSGDGRGKFTEDHLKLVLAIGRQAALAVERHRYEYALVKAERFAAMGQTIAVLSHHIKNILQGVRGGSYLIEMGLNQSDNELIRNGWNIVERNQGRIYNLVMDMLSFSTDRAPAVQSAILNDVVQEVCELMQVRAQEQDVQLELVTADDIPEALFDVEGIHRAVLNVVINAIEAVAGVDSARVRIATAWDPETKMLSVTVSDNGPGIADEQMASIFNIFASNKGAVGTGIGLAVSQKIIQEHGGRIDVETVENQGATFTLLWPRSDDDPPPIDGQTIVAE